MKASELIAELQKAIAVHGDLDVFYMGEDTDWQEVFGVDVTESKVRTPGPPFHWEQRRIFSL